MLCGPRCRTFFECSLFLLLLGTLLYGVNRLLTPKYYLNNRTWPTTASINKFYEMETNSIDVLFLGSSVAVNHFVPQVLYDECGIRSFNLGSEQQSIFLSYHWLKEALRFQSPKVVVLEALFLQNRHPECIINTAEGLTRKCIDPMHWSGVKLEAVRDICRNDASQSAWSYALVNIRFHDRWKSLDENDFLDSGLAVSDLLGWAPGKNACSFDRGREPFEESDGDASFQLRESMIEYFGKMVDLCRQKGIRLVLVKTPQEGATTTAAKIDCAYRRLAEEFGIDYFNLRNAALFGQLRTDPDKDSVYEHGNIWGNVKISRWTACMLRDHCHVPPAKDPQYEATRKLFDHVVSCAELGGITDIDEYLEAVRDDWFAVFVAVKDEASTGLRESTKAKLKELGLQQEWSQEMFRHGYIGIVTDAGIVEKSGGPVAASGLFKNSASRYAVSSAGFEDAGGPASSINIDGREYAVNSRGLNIVVYDLYSQRVIDRVAFDTYLDSAAKRMK